MNEKRDVKFSMKITPESDGFFSGHAAVFDKTDVQNEVILPGAFRESLAKKNVVPILWSQ